jgi:hypothetical protein
MLAQNADENARQAGALFGAGLMTCCVFVLVVPLFLIIIAGLWKVFTKAGQPGWAALIPIFNIYILCVIAGRPGWWTILWLIPVVGIVIAILVFIDVAKYFGKGAGFALGLFFLPYVFLPILGFGKSQYSGPAKPF